GESLRIRPDSSIALADLAWIRFLQGEIEESVALYRRSLASAPRNPDARKRLAIGLLLQADPAGAVAEVRAAGFVVPPDGEARELLEGATALAEKPSGAAASRVRSALAALHVKTAERLVARGKRSESLSHLRSAIELAPESGEAHARVGALLVE